MKQILQNLKTGMTQVTEVRCSQNKSGHFLICTRASLVSAGTERMLIDFGRAGLMAQRSSIVIPVLVNKSNRGFSRG